MAIRRIPNELLLEIGEYLSIRDLSHFLLTCHRLQLLLTPYLYKLGLKDKYGLTALQWAAQNGHALLAERAILEGAEIEKLLWWTEWGWPSLCWTPLHLAANSGHPAVTSILIEHGANIASNDSNQQTPLHLAANSGHSTIISILVEHGANTAANDCNQLTPLHLAVQSQHEEATKVLLDLGADMLCLDNLKPTPAHHDDTAAVGSVGCMKAFIEAGFDINF